MSLLMYAAGRCMHACDLASKQRAAVCQMLDTRSTHNLVAKHLVAKHASFFPAPVAPCTAPANPAHVFQTCVGLNPACRMQVTFTVHITWSFTPTNETLPLPTTQHYERSRGQR